MEIKIHEIHFRGNKPALPSVVKYYVDGYYRIRPIPYRWAVKALAAAKDRKKHYIWDVEIGSFTIWTIFRS